jgi:hypothetical protein
MSYPFLRTIAKLLTIVGWVHIVLGAVLGFLPWILFAGEPIPIMFVWEKWLLYASPLLGLLGGAVTGLGYIVFSQLILMLLDQRDTTDGILEAIRRLVRLQHPQAPIARGRDPLVGDEFDLEEKSL